MVLTNNSKVIFSKMRQIYCDDE